MAGTLSKSQGRTLLPTRTEWGFPLRREMEELFDRFWGEGNGGLEGRMTPSLNLSETENSVDVTMDLPGVKPSEIDIQIHGNLLTVSGERKEEKEEKGRTFHRVERTSGSFYRSVTLPCTVNESEAAAECHNGILTIHLPKSEEEKPQKIKVKG